MSEINAISPILTGLVPETNGSGASGPSQAGASFESMLKTGFENLESTINGANEMVREFAVDDSIPIHEVTIALEEARMAVELAMQVRTRLVEGYREIMNMQL